MPLVYKNVFKLENGVLVRNTVNKIEYTDKNGKKRTKTNPTYDDFAKVGFFPIKNVGNTPEYDIHTEYLEENIELKENCFEISYVVKKRDKETLLAEDSIA